MLRSSGSSEPAWFELSRLREITEGEPEFERQILGTFMDEAKRSLDELRSSAEDRHWDRFRKGLHRLKGQTGTMGFMGIHRLIKDLERVEEPEAMVEAFVRVEAEVERARATAPLGEPPEGRLGSGDVAADDDELRGTHRRTLGRALGIGHQIDIMAHGAQRGGYALGVTRILFDD